MVDTNPHRESYTGAGDGLKILAGDFNYWSQRLSDSSTQMSLAVIAGNWACYGSAQAVMRSGCALLSIGIIFSSLALTLFTSCWLSELHRRAYYQAENDWAAWESRFKKYRRGEIKNDPWPTTELIDCVTRVARYAKTALPLVAGAILVVGALHLPKASTVSAQTFQQTLILSASSSAQLTSPSLAKHPSVMPIGCEANGKAKTCSER